MSLASGHAPSDLEGEELARQQQHWRGYTEGLVRLTPAGWLFPSAFKNFADKYYNFKVKDRDVFVMTYPKCGTTWLQEVVWTMRNNPDLDNPAAATPANIRIPFLEKDSLTKSKNIPPMPDDHPMMKSFQKMCPGRDPGDGMLLQMAECSPSPRIIKTHLPFSLLPPDILDRAKVVYVARNPKDVVTSYLHHSRLLKVHGFVGSLEDFVQYFLDDDLVYGPYWLHLEEAWGRSHNPNLLIIHYEEMTKNNLEELARLNTFLATKLSEHQLKNVSNYTSFSEMKARDCVQGTVRSMYLNMEVVEKDGGFFRKGSVGDWRERLSPELEGEVDGWVKRNLGDLGIKFDYGE